MPLPNNSYALGVGEKGRERLELVNLLYEPYTRAFLQNAILESGMCVLDMGCGLGYTSRLLSEMVGSRGQVIAVDNSSEQIAYAKKLSEDPKFKNISYLCADLCDDNFKLDEKIDVVYGRLILAHMINPKFVLNNVCKFLHPHSKILLEEPITSDSISFPRNEWFNLHLELYVNLGEKMGVDYNFGRKIPDFITDLRFNLKRIDYRQSLVREKNLKKITLLRTLECREKYLSLNLIAPKHLESLLVGLTEFANNDESMVSGVRMCQAVVNI